MWFVIKKETDLLSHVSYISQNPKYSSARVVIVEAEGLRSLTYILVVALRLCI